MCHTSYSSQHRRTTLLRNNIKMFIPIAKCLQPSGMCLIAPQTITAKLTLQLVSNNPYSKASETFTTTHAARRVPQHSNASLPPKCKASQLSPFVHVAWSSLSCAHPNFCTFRCWIVSPLVSRERSRGIYPMLIETVLSCVSPLQART